MRFFEILTFIGAAIEGLLIVALYSGSGVEASQRTALLSSGFPTASFGHGLKPGTHELCRAFRQPFDPFRPPSRF